MPWTGTEFGKLGTWDPGSMRMIRIRGGTWIRIVVNASPVSLHTFSQCVLSNSFTKCMKVSLSAFSSLILAMEKCLRDLHLLNKSRGLVLQLVKLGGNPTMIVWQPYND